MKRGTKPLAFILKKLKMKKEMENSQVFIFHKLKMKKEVIEKLAALITAAFGLVAALAWNGAIQAIFKSVFGSADSIGAMLVYAIVVTIIAVWATVKIGKVAEKAK